MFPLSTLITDLFVMIIDMEIFYCECECGEQVAPGRRFVHGHNARLQTGIRERRLKEEWDATGIPYGYCLCGCGKPTSLAIQGSRRLGHVRGEPVFFVRGHATRLRMEYTVEDRGYETPCWIRGGWVTVDGYAKMVDDKGKQGSAHRVMWERVHGKIPAGLQLDHLCRQPACVNPAHLEPVTNAVNVRRSTTAKLDWEKVRAIRAARSKRVSRRALAEKYGVNPGTIWWIDKDLHWPAAQDPLYLFCPE